MRGLLVSSAGRERLRGPPVLEKKRGSQIHGPNIIDFTIAQYAIEVVIYIDEPALVAEPGWLQDQQLAP